MPSLRDELKLRMANDALSAFDTASSYSNSYSDNYRKEMRGYGRGLQRAMQLVDMVIAERARAARRRATTKKP